MVFADVIIQDVQFKLNLRDSILDASIFCDLEKKIQNVIWVYPENLITDQIFNSVEQHLAEIGDIIQPQLASL